jgi:hypothetical protein
MAPIVGFDFDDCLTNTYSLLPVILLLEGQLIKELKNKNISMQTKESILVAIDNFYNALAENEVNMKGVILRPSFLRILPILLKKRAAGEIQTIFIYSNNTNHILINTIDHILALTLLKLGVPESHLISEIYGSTKRLQALSPRFFWGSECRSNEDLNGNFKEKSLDGIFNCLGITLPESDVWFLDDSVHHKSLIHSLKSNYLQIKKYDVELKNKKLAELLVKSFPKEAFNPMAEIGNVFIKSYSAIESQFILRLSEKTNSIKEDHKFNPKYTDDVKACIKKLKESFNMISPLDKGGVSSWTTVETNTDYTMIMKRLEPLLNPKPFTRFIDQSSLLNIGTATAYREPFVGGRQSSKRSPVNSRSRKKRLFTCRRKTE